jgi:pimeloyl-ACP methyl ester carboxylesterase
VLVVVEAWGEPVVLVAHSRGGLVAAVVASRRPELVRGICYEDVTPLFVHSPLTKTHPVMESVFGLGAVVSRMRTEDHDVGWLTDQVAIRPHDDKRTFGEDLPRSAILAFVHANDL